MSATYHREVDSMSISSGSYDIVEEFSPGPSSSSSTPPTTRIIGYYEADAFPLPPHKTTATTRAEPPTITWFKAEEEEYTAEGKTIRNQHHIEAEEFLTGVRDHDFASFPPEDNFFHTRLTQDFEPIREAASPRHSIHMADSKRQPNRWSILSMQQHAAEPIKPPAKWFERVDHASFQLRITPRSHPTRSPLSASSATSSRPSASRSSSSASTSSSASSSHPPGHTATQHRDIHNNLPLASLLDDPTAFSRLLVSALFTMNDVPDKDAAAKMHQLGLVPAKTSGARQFAMRHEKLDPLTGMPISSGDSQGKRLVFKIAVRDRSFA